MGKEKKGSKKIELVFIGGTMFFMMFFSLCCANNLDNLRSNEYNYQRNRISFQSAVQFSIDIKANLCLSIKGEDGKQPCADKELRSAGSGFIIKSNSTESLVMTADHVCRFKLNLPSFVIVNKLETKSLVKDFNGNEHIFEVFSYDEEADLCIVKVKGLKNFPIVKIATVEPLIGERVFNIGYPRGIYSPNTILIYEGFYSGVFNKEKNIAAYSIFAVGGSSGSVLMNTKGEMIGLIHSGFSNMEHFSFSPTFKAFKEFIHKAFLRFSEETIKV